MKSITQFLVCWLAILLTGANGPGPPKPENRDDPNDIVAVKLRNGVNVSLDEWGNVRTVVFRSMPSDDVLRHLARLHNVRNVQAKLIASDKLIDWLKIWPGLETLDVSRSPNIRNKGFHSLGDMASLHNLNLSHVRISAAQLAQLAGLRHLKTLDLANAGFSMNEVVNFGALVELEKLNLSYTGFTDDELATLSSLRKLREVDLAYGNITDAGLEHLKALDDLQVIALDYTRVTSRGIASLKDHKKLQQLSLWGTGATDDWVAPLRAIKSFKAVGVRSIDDGIPTDDPAKVAALAAAGVALRKDPWGNVYDVRPLDPVALKNALRKAGSSDRPGNDRIHVPQRPGAWMVNLNGLKSLKELELPPGVRDEDMVHLRSLTKLQGLSVGSSLITDSGLENLSGLSDIRALSVESSPGVTGTGLAKLPFLEKLNSLRLSGTSIDDARLSLLTRCRNLNFLYLDRTGITDAALEHVASLTKLRGLSLRDTKVTDACLVQLVGMTDLSDLSIGCTAITFDGFELLRGSLPNLSEATEFRNHPW